MPSLKTSSSRGWLPDVSTLVALTNAGHIGHSVTSAWIAASSDSPIFLCSVTEAAFVRLLSSPVVGGLSIPHALAMLREFLMRPNVIQLPMNSTWLAMIQPFEARLTGHRQVTDALLLGLAIQNNAVLVTLDRGIKMLAGPDYAHHVLVLGDPA